jgi:hypothetical protein
VDHGGHVEYQEGAGEPRKHTQQGRDPIQFRITESKYEFNSDPKITMPSN